MVGRLIVFGSIALIGFGCFVVAVLFLTKGANAEWVTLILAPAAGICLATVMHYANIEISSKVLFVVKDGRLLLKFNRS